MVFAIFGTLSAGLDARQAGLAGGCALAAGVLFGFPLTGAALNPRVLRNAATSAPYPGTARDAAGRTGKQTAASSSDCSHVSGP